MTFHESDPVPTQGSQKRLKLQFNSTSISAKRNFIQDIPQLIQKNNDIEIVTFNNVEDQPNYQQRLDAFGTPPNNILTPHNYSKEIKVNGKNNHVSSTREEDPIISIQGRLQQPNTPPHKINPSTTPPHPIGGRGRGAYARYGGERGGRGLGRGPHPPPRYSTDQRVQQC